MTKADDLLVELRGLLHHVEYRRLPRAVGSMRGIDTLMSRGILERIEMEMDDPRRRLGGRFLYRLAKKDQETPPAALA